MIKNEKCEVLDKQNFEPKYRSVYDKRTGYNIRYNINLTNWNGIKSNQIIIDIRMLEIIF